MATESPVYNELNKAWKSTCRIVLGDEIGELKGYEPWLSEYMQTIGRRKSHVSGRDVILSMDDYSKSAKFVSLDEVKEKTTGSLTINQVKDIDSIAQAVSEKWEYVGNRVLGNSQFVESSDAVINSQYVSDSTAIQNCQYIFGSSVMTTNSKYVFGGLRTDTGEFLIRCIRGAEIKRNFETYYIVGCKDAYFSAGCLNCTDIMFSFNLKNKSNCIGNLQLPKDKYQSIKKKLLDEIREELKANKKFPGIFEIVSNEPTKDRNAIKIAEKKREERMDLIDKAFNSTLKIILKRDFSGKIDDYGAWLSRHIGVERELDTPFGRKTYILPKEYYPLYVNAPDKRFLTAQEAIRAAEFHMDEADLSDLDSIRKNIAKVGYFVEEMENIGQCSNIIKTAAAFDSTNVYRVRGSWKSENTAFTDQSVLSKHVFGGRIANCQFCINCYDSNQLNRCLEVESCERSSDTMFSHNCEGMTEAMFCWNVKGKRYAIGNMEYAPDKYKGIKDGIIAQIADELAAKKSLKWDIFNIGGGKA